MNAAVYYETGVPGVLKYEDVPDPSCGKREIVIDIKAISIEGGDVLNRAGGPMPAVPHIVGYEAGRRSAACCLFREACYYNK